MTIAWALPVAFAMVLVAIASMRPWAKGPRWVFAVLAALLPALAPSRGVASTILTGVAIVIAVRLTDLPRLPQNWNWGERAFWLWNPLLRGFPAEKARRRHNRRAALKTLARAVAKRALWEPFALIQATWDGDAVPTVARTAFLVLYFVLNFTALADLAIAFCQLLGADIDEVFDWPLLSTSPREFWGRRWNRFISRFALKHLALPLRGRLRPAWLTLVVFFASGTFHEYFAWGVSGERTIPLSMMGFFLTQGLLVLLVDAIRPWPRLPKGLKIAFVASLMVLTSPFFFRPMQVAYEDLNYPASWYPWPCMHDALCGGSLKTCIASNPIRFYSCTQ